MLDLASRPPALLLSFATCTPETIAEGVGELGRLVREQLATRERRE